MIKEHYIYTCKAGTFFVSCEDSRTYSSPAGKGRPRKGTELIRIHDCVHVKAKSSVIKQYYGKTNRKIDKDLMPAQISEKDFLKVFHSALEIEHHQTEIIKIRDKY